ncbi:MAG: hypothetical protein KDC44_23435 [Phaeodactylibacter sp.]|nr:hypothetical protein [Phaeodactylibacter sp.]
MRSLLHWCACLLLAAYLPAQSYEFELDSEPFVPLDDPVSLNNGGLWFSDEWQINPGFDFEFFDVPFSSVLLWEGSVYFNDDLFLDAFGASFQDLGWYSMNGVSLSPVSYQVEGAVGSRVLKLEYLNAGFWPATVDDFINFQVWLFESTNIIEIHIGPGMVDPAVYQQDGWDGPYIGLSNYETDEFIYIQGDPTNPEVYDLDDLTDGMNATPPEEVVYRFLPDDYVSTMEPVRKPSDLSVWYQSGTLYLEQLQGGERIALCGLLGQVIEGPWLAQAGKNDLLLEQQPASGLYIVRVECADGQQTGRLVFIQDQ